LSAWITSVLLFAWSHLLFAFIIPWWHFSLSRILIIFWVFNCLSLLWLL
jgi:hypothetical protein